MSQLSSLQREGDPLADELAVSLIDFGALEASSARLSATLKWLGSLTRNEDLLAPRFPAAFDAATRARLEAFLDEVHLRRRPLDLEKIRITEAYFERSGFLSSLIFLCASLPEVYVRPDISSVLYATGQLESATEQRIRATATMVLSVLLEGGLSSAHGFGLVLALKARLVHAFIRVLLLRGAPEQVDRKAAIPPIRMARPPRSLFEVAYTHGWDLDGAGVPCNQQELLYTLLSFHFVYMRSVRRLGLSMSAIEQEAYLSTWNVVGDALGIREVHLPRSFEAAEQRFGEIRRGAVPRAADAEKQHTLAKALIAPLENAVAFDVLTPLCRFLIRYLTGEETTSSLGLKSERDTPFYAAFSRSLRIAVRSPRIVEPICRRVSLAIINNIFLSDGKPIALPPAQLAQVDVLMSRWMQR